MDNVLSKDISQSPASNSPVKRGDSFQNSRQSESPAPRHLPLVHVLIDAQAELQRCPESGGRS